LAFVQIYDEQLDTPTSPSANYNMLSNNEQHEAKQSLPPSIPHLTSHEGKKANKNEHIAWDSSANSMKGILKIADHTRFDKYSILDIV
jgi:hypothetical protein